MRQAALLSLLLAAALAGCTSGAKSDDPALPDTSKGRDPAVGNTTDVPPLLGVLVFTPTGGEAPLNVTFRLDAMGASSDLRWSLAFGDGEAIEDDARPLPLELNHTYAAEGNYTVSYALRDGNRSVDLTYDVAVAAGLPAGTVVLTEPFADSGSITAGLYEPNTSGDPTDPLSMIRCGGGVSGSAEYEWTFRGSLDDGTPVLAQHVTLTLDSADDTNQMDVDLYILAPDGTEVGKSTSATPDEAIDVTGAFPAGAYTVQVLGCAAAAIDFTLAGEVAYGST